MSKQTITIEVDICDFCNKERGIPYYKCITCRKVPCSACRDMNMVEYPDGVDFRSGKMGFYCQACNNKHRADFIDPLWIAYHKIKAERQALAEAYDLNRTRAKKLEAELSALYSQYFPSK